MTIPAADYERAIATGSEAIGAALDAGPGRPVPNCPGWNLGQLAGHLGALYERVAEQVRRRSKEPLRDFDFPAPPQGPTLSDWLGHATEELLQAISRTDDDSPAGHWRAKPVTAGFWRRRMAHETVVHRVDAGDALGEATALESDLAADGVEETLELFLPFSIRKDRWPPNGALWLVRADGPQTWRIEPAEDRVQVHRACHEALPRAGVARVEAGGAELFLLCWGRRPPPPGGVRGDRALLDHWLSVFEW